MINWTKFKKEFTEFLHSQTADDLQKWLDMDRKRMALVDVDNLQPVAMGKLNGASRNINGASVKNSVPLRDANGKFVSAKSKKAKATV